MSSTSRAMVGGIGIALAAATYLQAARPPDAPPSAPRPQAARSQQAQQASISVPSAAIPQRALLDKYCVTCHNERRQTAGLMLDKMDVEHLSAGAETWEKVVHKLRSGAMPPAGAPRPDKATGEAFVSWLETTLDRAAAEAPNPGRPAIRRLNRVEYTNAIRDLLAVGVDGRSLLPPDESGYGFDNNGDTLSLSPGLLERYMSAARKISRLAVGDQTMRPVLATINLSRQIMQEERMSEDLPFGSRGGLVVAHNFPLDGDYIFKVRLKRTFNSPHNPFGSVNREQLDVRLDGTRLKLFAVGGECVGKEEPQCISSLARGGPTEYEMNLDLPLEIRRPVKAGMHSVQVAFVKRTAAAPEGAVPSDEPNGTTEGDEMAVDHLLLEGPIGASVPEDTLSRRRIFACHPVGSLDGEPCATKILSTLARRAYRRPVADRDVQPLLNLYRTGRSDGGFEAGIQLALEGLLVSPRFLTRVERDPVPASGTAGRISDLELASRLSFFLWSSIPDDELVDVAAKRKLSDPKMLEQQVRRMLADPRATALMSNFGGQWLYLRNMREVVPDPRVFPNFNESLREAFQRETELFLESQLREDHSLVDLLTANYTFLNERLAKHYGVPNVYGSHFRRVTVSDERRFGLLGHASVLTVTSYATRTSPVLRGKYLLENFFGAPPPPPPPNVETDLTQKPGEVPKSVRARLEAHRKNPVCASCHMAMDPLGFALENFDGIGKWRTTEARTPIDASGALPDGTKFNGPIEFRQVLLSRRQEFVTTVTEKLLTYALGRGSEYYDRPAIRKILRNAAPSDYRWSSVILGIVKSTPFQMRPAQQRGSIDASSSAQVR
jgi:mono/diheme cytochrome c family protein